MRKYLLLIVYLSYSFHAFSQPARDSVKTTSAKDLTILSKKQQTAGIILTTTGTLMLSIALGMSISNLNSLFDPGDYPFDNSTIDVLAVAGTIALAGGIYLLVKSRHNKKKAIRMGFILQPFHDPHFTRLSERHFPAAQLQIRF